MLKICDDNDRFAAKHRGSCSFKTLLALSRVTFTHTGLQLKLTRFALFFVGALACIEKVNS